VIADVPASRAMVAARDEKPATTMISRANLDDLSNVRTALMDRSLPDNVYCDWAHMDPARADVWQRAFFGSVASDLNSL